MNSSDDSTPHDNALPHDDSGSPAGHRPSIGIAIIPLISLIIFLYILLRVFEISDPHLAIVFGTGVAVIVALIQGYKWSDLEDGLVEGIQIGLKAVLILMVVGMLIATWIAAGVVPLMIDYGLALMHPSYFYVAGCAICAVVSMATGSSWTTAGTVGVALIGVAQGLGLSEAIAAGAIVSGAYFGDKLSPLSDSTNLAPAVAGSELFSHIRHMLYTTIPSITVSLIIYALIGFFSDRATAELESVNQIRATLAGHFNLSPWLLVAPVIVVVMVWRKLPALPALFAASLIGIVMGVIFQETPVRDMMNYAFAGYSSGTGVAEVDDLLNKGGLSEMMWTVSLIFCALGFGGVMMKSRMLEAIALGILRFATNPWKLVGATNLSCVVMNLATADQYLAIAVPGKMFRQAYSRMGLAAKNLSRSLEDAGTLTSPLVFWNTCGATMRQYLGVDPMTYAPFAFFNWLSPIFSVVMAFFGWGLHKSDQEK